MDFKESKDRKDCTTLIAKVAALSSGTIASMFIPSEWIMQS